MQSINNNQFTKTILVAGLLLAAFSLVAALLIAFTYQGTNDRIQENRRAFILQSLEDVMPLTSYDNDLIADSYTINDPLLGPEQVKIYPAFSNLQPAGAIITSIAENGYNGKIKILVGVNHSGVIHAVRVVAHKETPGLGDPIEIQRSDWIRQFDQRSLNNPTQESWLVKKDGGDFDQLTGATVTPRAVIAAVNNALLYFQEHRDQIYSKN